MGAINSDDTVRTKVSRPVFKVTEGAVEVWRTSLHVTGDWIWLSDFDGSKELKDGNGYGTTAEEVMASYQTLTSGAQIIYPGDADLVDLGSDGDFSSRPLYDVNSSGYHKLDRPGGTATSGNSKRDIYFTTNASGIPDLSTATLIASDPTVGTLKYEKDGKYIVFRDINMAVGYNVTVTEGKGGWKPLMFTGEMYGVKVNGDGGKLWDDGKTQMNLDTSVKPEIYNINVNAVAMASTLFSDNSSKLDLDVHTGVGFFGTLTGSGTGDKTEDPDDPDKEIYDLVGNLCVVRNIRLRDGSVTNQLTAAKQKETVINFLTGTLGAALDLIVSPLLRRLTGKDDIGLSALTDVLNTRVSNSTNLATGAFAGRIMGNVLVADCEVKDIEVSSVLTDAENPDSASLGTNKPKIVGTGGFVGHAEGATSYEGLSKVLGSVGVILGSTLGIGQFIGFEVSNTYITGIDDVTGYTVQTGANIDENDIEKGDYAGGALGWAAGGDVYDVELNRLGSVSGNNHVGGFAGTTGPGDLVSNDGLNLQLLGISLISANNLLSLLSAERTTYLRANVKGITAGYTVTETGLIEDNATDEEYTAGGFFGDANSVRIVDCHADNLLSVTANSHDGIAGGFVGRSAAGDTADAVEHVDTDDVTQLLALNELVNAIPLLVPSYDGCDVTYVDGGYVEGDAAGGFTGDFRSGKINTYTMETTVISGNTYTGVNPIDDPNTTYEYECGNMTKPWSVNNIRYVRGGNYGGGWGGHVYPGALASAGGGLSILGVADTSALSATDLLGVADVYIPIIKYAGVHSENGFTVYAAHDESNGTNPATAGYAGGFVGLASVGSVAQIGGSQTNILSLLNVGNIGLLDVFRTYIYRSTVEGVAEGVRVYAHDWQQPGGSLQSTKVTGAAGGFVGGLMSGTIEDCSVTNLNYVEAPNYAAGFCGHSGVKGVLDVSGLEVADNDSILARLLAVLGLDLSAALQLLNIIGSTFERDTVTGYHRPERHCVISGHTGLPSARLFTDLERIVVGDTFTINTLGVVLTYEVDQIVVVNPWESDELRIFSGKDYCTLLTFTPYGVNSHRLLVRGHRIETTEEVAAAVLNVELVYRKTAEPFFIAVGVAVLIIIIAIILVVIRLIVNRKRKKNEKRAQETCADNKSRAGDASDAQESSDGKESE